MVAEAEKRVKDHFSHCFGRMESVYGGEGKKSAGTEEYGRQR